MANVFVSRRRVLALALGSIGAFASRAVPSAFAEPAPVDVELLDADTSASSYCPDSQEAKFLSLINSYRAKNGVGKLALSGTLGAAAEHHSIEMARYNYFSHTLRNAVSWVTNITNHGYKASGTMGENIAAGHSAAIDTFTQWRNSPGHNRNMLNPSFRAIGIGRAHNSLSKYGWYWTTTFGGAQDRGPAC
jgi:uncharacterized protein YkwD